MNYIDTFVAAVPDANRPQYLEFVRTTGQLFKECGALRVVDCWGDDVPEGKLTSFPMAVKREPGESVVFGWVAWESKEARDAGWAKAMADPRMSPASMKLPYDGKRMIFAGFQTIADT